MYGEKLWGTVQIDILLEFATASPQTLRDSQNAWGPTASPDNINLLGKKAMRKEQPEA